MSILLVTLALAALCRLRVMAPTASSPSAEDFSGLSLSTGLQVSGGKVCSAYTGAGKIETFDSKDEAFWTYFGAADRWSVSSGKFNALYGSAGWLMQGIKMAAALAFAVGRVIELRYLGIIAPPASYYISYGITEAYGVGQASVDQNGDSYVGYGGVSWESDSYTRFVMPSPKSLTMLRLVYERPTSTTLRMTVYATPTSTGIERLVFAREVTLTVANATPYLMPGGGALNGLLEGFSVLCYPTAALTAELPAVSAFQPTGGANLAALVSITPTLDGTGAAGTVTLYLQKYSTEHGWTSLGGVADAWTNLGAVTSGVPIDLSSYEMRSGAKLRWKAEFLSTDGTLPAPALSGLALAWTSDTSAPGVPTITQLLSSCGAGGVGPRPVLQIASLPTGARHVEVEVDRKPAGGSWAGSLPLSSRNAIESGQGYLELRGAQEAEQAAGEENALHLAIPGTWAVGDEVRAKARAVDAMGNASAWTDTTAAVEIAQPYPAPTVTDVTPSPLAEAGGTELTIAGTGFLDGATVTVDGEACTEVVVESDTEITATSPAASYGPATLTVTNPDSQVASIAVMVGVATYVPVLTTHWRAVWAPGPWRVTWR